VVFRGTSNLTLDNKGRLVIPARHRDPLLEHCGGHLVITAHADRCLLLYPLAEWEVIQQKLDSLSNLDRRVRDLQRRLIGYAVDTDMDSAGRVLVAPELRRYARLEREVALVGQGKKLELWNRAAWEERNEPAIEVAPEGVPQPLENLSL
jgi:MraZ protein